MRAELELECANPELVIKAIKPDMTETGKFKAVMKAEKTAVKLTVEAKDIGALLAGVNSYARLIKTSADMDNLEE